MDPQLMSSDQAAHTKARKEKKRSRHNKDRKKENSSETSESSRKSERSGNKDPANRLPYSKSDSCVALGGATDLPLASSSSIPSLDLTASASQGTTTDNNCLSSVSSLSTTTSAATPPLVNGLDKSDSQSPLTSPRASCTNSRLNLTHSLEQQQTIASITDVGDIFKLVADASIASEFVASFTTLSNEQQKQHVEQLLPELKHNPSTISKDKLNIGFKFLIYMAQQDKAPDYQPPDWLLELVINRVPRMKIICAKMDSLPDFYKQYTDYYNDIFCKHILNKDIAPYSRSAKDNAINNGQKSSVKVTAHRFTKLVTAVAIHENKQQAITICKSHLQQQPELFASILHYIRIAEILSLEANKHKNKHQYLASSRLINVMKLLDAELNELSCSYQDGDKKIDLSLNSIINKNYARKLKALYDNHNKTIDGFNIENYPAPIASEKQPSLLAQSMSGLMSSMNHSSSSNDNNTDDTDDTDASTGHRATAADNDANIHIRTRGITS